MDETAVGVVDTTHDDIADSDGTVNMTAEGADTDDDDDNDDDDDVNGSEDDTVDDTDDDDGGGTVVPAGARPEDRSPQSLALRTQASSLMLGSADICQAAPRCGSFNKSFNLLKMGSWYGEAEAGVVPLLASGAVDGGTQSVVVVSATVLLLFCAAGGREGGVADDTEALSPSPEFCVLAFTLTALPLSSS